MKQFHPLLRRRLACVLLAIALTITSFQAHAQKIYATSQANGVNGWCTICKLSNPNNPINQSSLNDYSEFNITAGVGNVSMWQNLIFASLSNPGCDSLIVGIGCSNTFLYTGMLGCVTIQTYKGNIANNDKKTLDKVVLRKQSDNRAEVLLKPTQAFDRVKITVSTGIMGGLRGFRLFYAYRSGMVSSGPKVSPADTTVCANSPVTFRASGTPGAIIRWYDAATGGNLLATGDTYSVSPAAAATFYAEAESGSCHSARTPAKVKVRPAPTVTTEDSVHLCVGSTASLTATAGASDTIKWYDAPTDGQLLHTGSPFEVNPDSTTLYYVAAENGCSSERKTVKVTVEPCNTPGCVPVPFSPLMYYGLNGNANDGSGNNHNGTDNGTYYTTDAICGQAGYFNGSSNMTIGSGSSATSALPKNQLTVATWVKVNFSEASIIHAANDFKGWYLETFSGQFVFTLGVEGFNAHQLVFGGAYENNKWYHVVGVYDGDSIKIFVNGNLTGSLYYPGVISYPSTAEDFFGIGMYKYTGFQTRHFNGTVDEVYIFDKAMSNQQVKQFYQSYNIAPLAKSSAVSQARLDFNTALTDNVAAVPLKVFPNPSSGEVKISAAKDLGGSMLIVYDLQGKEVKREILQNNVFRMQGPDGLYVIKVITKDKQTLQAKVMLRK